MAVTGVVAVVLVELAAREDVEVSPPETTKVRAS
jgi:hypothetical protein